MVLNCLRASWSASVLPDSSPTFSCPGHVGRDLRECQGPHVGAAPSSPFTFAMVARQCPAVLSHGSTRLGHPLLRPWPPWGAAPGRAPLRVLAPSQAEWDPAGVWGHPLRELPGPSASGGSGASAGLSHGASLPPGTQSKEQGCVKSQDRWPLPSS